MGKEERLKDEVIRIFFVFASVRVWFFLVQSAAEYLGWPSRSVGWSYLASFYGASAAYLVGRTTGRLRRVIYDSPFAAYLNLLIVAIPLFFVYLTLQSPSLPGTSGGISQLASSPLTLASAWFFSFTAYRFLDRLCNRVGGVFQKSELPVRLKAFNSSARPSYPVAKEVVGRLEGAAGKLAAKISALEKHAQELYDRTVKAQAAGNTEANFYLRAYKDVKRNVDLLVKKQLQLEGLAERLKTLDDLAETMPTLPPVFKTVLELEGKLRKSFPEFSYELERIGRTVEELLSRTQVPRGSSESPQVEGAAQKILLEAAGVAEARIRHRKD